MKKWASRCGYMVEYSQVTVTWQLLYLFHMFLVCFPLIEVTGLKKADPSWWHSVIVTSSCSPPVDLFVLNLDRTQAWKFLPAVHSASDCIWCAKPIIPWDM